MNKINKSDDDVLKAASDYVYNTGYNCVLWMMGHQAHCQARHRHHCRGRVVHEEHDEYKWFSDEFLRHMIGEREAEVHFASDAGRLKEGVLRSGRLLSLFRDLDVDFEVKIFITEDCVHHFCCCCCGYGGGDGGRSTPVVVDVEVAAKSYMDSVNAEWLLEAHHYYHKKRSAFVVKEPKDELYHHIIKRRNFNTHFGYTREGLLDAIARAKRLRLRW